MLELKNGDVINFNNHYLLLEGGNIVEIDDVSQKVGTIPLLVTSDEETIFLSEEKKYIMLTIFLGSFICDFYTPEEYQLKIREQENFMAWVARVSQ